MMIRQRRLPIAIIASLCSVVLALSACGSPSTDGGTSADAGEPVAGGVGRIVQVAEPRSLDPAVLGNVWATQPELGNALYGTLMVDDRETSEIEYKMAEDFSTSDGGDTYNMTLRPGLQFTDGTPLDAGAVKFNWDRMRDPALGSGASKVSPQIADIEVVDPTTLTVTMVAPNQHFAQAVVTSSLNWIASPTALQKSREEFDREPVGAGPFVLKSWARQNKMEFVKNTGYWDAPKPYLEALSVQFVPDAAQRFNAVVSGGVDFASESNAANVNKAESAGLATDIVEIGGGYYLAMNTRRAPFDDERARKAVSMALDLDMLNEVVYGGAGTVPEKLFTESSPFHSDFPLRETRKEEAQALFDELAAEGKAVSFDYTSYSTSENKQTGEAVQAQLSAYENVDVEINALDSSAIGSVVANRNFQMVVTSANVLDPDTELWVSFSSKSAGNMTGISDPELDAALDAGRVGTSVEERKAAYDVVQERLSEVVPGVFFVRSVPASVANSNVHGVVMYGLGSPLPEEMWLNE